MIEFSSSLKLNEIHVVDSTFNEDTKNIDFSREALISGKGKSENFGKWTITGTSIVMQMVVNFEREYQSLPPGTKILVMPQFSYMPDQILGKKLKKLNFQAKICPFFRVFPSQNIRTYSKILYMTKCFWL